MPTRRQLLQALLATGAAGGLSATLPFGARLARASDPDDPRFLVVFGCFGGASMMDAFMPVDTSEALTVAGRGTVLSHPTWQPDGSNIRCVDRDGPRSFLSRFRDEMLVMATQSSSVNHQAAQQRWVSGRDALRGRTMAELVAETYGGDRALPNVNMGKGGYAAQGSDPSVEPRHRGQVVTNPVVFPLSTHGYAGVLPMGGAGLQDPDAQAALMAQARAFRDTQLEARTPFAQTFSNSRRRQEILLARRGSDAALEARDLVQRLLFVPDLGDLFPISRYGLTASEQADRVLDALPRAFPVSTSGRADDPFQAQAALAYLLLQTGTSCAVTVTDPGTDGFLAFDNSHTNHRSAQAAHWDRQLDVASRLAGLLQTAEFFDADGEPTGTSLWDRTMFVFATEFGRDKWDVGGGFGTGHHLNNGMLVVSPMLRGNRTLGVADPNNGFLCGFEADSGEPTPFDDVEPGEDPLFSDPRLPPGEEAVCGSLLATLGVNFPGQQTVPAIMS